MVGLQHDMKPDKRKTVAAGNNTVVGHEVYESPSFRDGDLRGGGVNWYFPILASTPPGSLNFRNAGT